MKWGVVLACGYEVIAITTGKTPTFTMLCARHRLLAPAVLTVIAVHLYRQPRISSLPDDPGRISPERPSPR